MKGSIRFNHLRRFLFSLACRTLDLWNLDKDSPQISTLFSLLSSYASGELNDRALNFQLTTNESSHRHVWPTVPGLYWLCIYWTLILGQFHFLAHTYTKSLGLFEPKWIWNLSLGFWLCWPICLTVEKKTKETLVFFTEGFLK